MIAVLPDRGRGRARRLDRAVGRCSSLLGLPRLIAVLKTSSEPRPETPPHSYVGWPLWFVGAAFVHTRRAGGLLVLGLLLNAFLPIQLPWVA